MSSIDRLQSRVIERSCKTLNDYPNCSAKDISTSVHLLKEMFATNLTTFTLAKALECRVIDGIIKIIDAPKKAELHKDENGIFTDSVKGILPGALQMLSSLVKNGCVLADTISSFFAVKDVLFTIFKKILQKTSRKVSVDEFASLGTNECKCVSVNDESTTTEEPIDLVVVENNSAASFQVMWFLGRLADTSEPCNCDPNNKAICHADLVIAQGFPAIMIKNIAFIIHVWRHRHANQGTYSDATTDQDKQRQQQKCASKMEQFDSVFETTVWALQCCLRPKNALFYRQLEQQNVIPLLVETMSVVDGSPKEKEIKASALWCLNHITAKIEPDGGGANGKKKKIPKTILQKVVTDGNLRKILKITKFDNIDAICLREDDKIAFPTLRILGNMTTDPDFSLQEEIIRHDGVAILVKLLDHENKEIRQEAAWIVSNLCANVYSRSFDIVTMFVLCGVMKKMTVLVKSPSQPLNIRRECMHAIQNITFILRDNIHPSVVNNEHHGDDKTDNDSAATPSTETQQQRKTQSLEMLKEMIEEDKIHLSLVEALQLFLEDCAEFVRRNPTSYKSSCKDSSELKALRLSTYTATFLIQSSSAQRDDLASCRNTSVFQAMKSKGLGKILKNIALPTTNGEFDGGNEHLRFLLSLCDSGLKER